MNDVRIRFDENGNARCGYCHRMLFVCAPHSFVSGIEIKCHSCKMINVTERKACGACKWRKNIGGCIVCACEHSEKLGTEITNNDQCGAFETK